MEKSIYTYWDYKSYVTSALDSAVEKRGQRSKLAKSLGCQTAFVSQVLNSDTHFSLEHSILVGQFLGLSKEENNYLILLVNYARAGNHHLKNHFLEQIKQVQVEAKKIEKRISSQSYLAPLKQSIYYSAWYYSAVHILVSIPTFQTPHAISQHLHLPRELVKEVLDFLENVGLIMLQNNLYKIGPTRIHVGKASPYLAQHHINWRHQAIQSLTKKDFSNFHYSSVVSLSLKDAEEIKGLLLAALEKSEKILQASKEEAAFGFCFDFFKV